MKQTENYQLNQWESTDRILMEDFNTDNEKIDAALAACGNCRVVIGTYNGTGTYGVANPNILTFDGTPLLVFVSGPTWNMCAARGSATAYTACGPNTDIWIYTTWGDNFLSWYNLDSIENQLNKKVSTYTYVAFLTVGE